MSVHENTLKSLQEALEYVRGDESKGRSMVVETPDRDIEFYHIYHKLSNDNKLKVYEIASSLLQANS
ncbi:MAG: hypothetical protein FWG90_04550 [Oscillospiraceae bacterium]|nr:hypothetical protein [Oscillospiraceae bacterium]